MGSAGWTKLGYGLSYLKINGGWLVRVKDWELERRDYPVLDEATGQYTRKFGDCEREGVEVRGLTFIPDPKHVNEPRVAE